MSRIRENLRVVVIGENNNIEKGTVRNVHCEVRLAIVEMDDGSFKKVSFDRIGVDESRNDKVSTEPEKIQEEKTQSQDGAKVITKDQFIEAVHYVTSPVGMLGDKPGEVDPMIVMIKGMSVFIVGMKISEKLFQDKEEIEITKDQLKKVIEENTSPTEIAKTTDGKMSVSEVLPVSMLSMLVLHGLIDILFDDSKNE